MKNVFVRNHIGPGHVELTAENDPDRGNLDNVFPKTPPEGMVLEYERTAPHKARLKWTNKKTGEEIAITEKPKELPPYDGLDELTDEELISVVFTKPNIKMDPAWGRPEWIKALRDAGYRKPETK
jgi:hypothetical protein